VRDTYRIEVAPGENDALILAATVCNDEMTQRLRAPATPQPRRASPHRPRAAPRRADWHL